MAPKPSFAQRFRYRADNFLARGSSALFLSVILAEESKEEIDEELRTRFTDRRNMRLVTRSGPTASLQSLERVNAHAAKSAIVLASCDPSAMSDDKLASDARVIKTVLALNAVIPQWGEFHIVAEIFDSRNRQVVKDIAPERVSVVRPAVHVRQRHHPAAAAGHRCRS